MKKSHLVLLAVTAILAFSSAYSLAAINQVYAIHFEWYSQLNGRYEDESRDISRDRCMLQSKQLNTGLSIEESRDNADDSIYIYCTLGDVNSPEYRIKVAEIAQRGNIMEVKISINTPESVGEDEKGMSNPYYPEDVVKINKAALPTKGRLYVIFKNQDGKQLDAQYCEVT